MTTGKPYATRRKVWSILRMWWFILCHRLGWQTCYFVAFDPPAPNGTFSRGSMTITMSPWLCGENYKELQAYLETQYPGQYGKRLLITSITKIGGPT